MKIFLTTLVSSLFLVGCLGGPLSTSTLTCTMIEVEEDVSINSTMDVTFSNDRVTFLDLEMMMEFDSAEEAEMMGEMFGPMFESDDAYVEYSYSIEDATFIMTMSSDVEAMIDAGQTDGSITFDDDFDVTLGKDEFKVQLEEEGWQCR